MTAKSIKTIGQKSLSNKRNWIYGEITVSIYWQQLIKWFDEANNLCNPGSKCNTADRGVQINLRECEWSDSKNWGDR